MTIRKPNRVTTPKWAVLNGTRTSHSSMPRARGRWRPEGPSREPGGAREDTTLLAGRGNDDMNECGAPLTLGPQHDPYQTTCDQAEGHYPGTDHAGPHPLGTRPGDRITWRGGSVAGDPVPHQVTGTRRSNEALRRAAVAGGGSRPYKRDLTEGNKGLSGNGYVVGELDTSHRDADGEWIPGLERVPIRIRTPRRCDHCETVCLECAESWMFDWVFYFDRTAGGRLLRAGLGGDEALAAMARRRADWEKGHRSARDDTAGPDSSSQAGEQPK